MLTLGIHKFDYDALKKAYFNDFQFLSVKVQAALAIRGFAIRGFIFIPKICYSRVFPWLFADFHSFCLKNKTFWRKQCSLVISGFGINGSFQERNPRE